LNMRTRKSTEWQVSYGESARQDLSSLPNASRRDVVARLDMLAAVGELAFCKCLVATRPGSTPVHALDLGGRYALVIQHVRGLTVRSVLDGKSFAAFCRGAAEAELETADLLSIAPSAERSPTSSHQQLS